MEIRARRWVVAVLAVLVLTGGLVTRALVPAAVGGPLGDGLYATLVVLFVALVCPRTTPWVAAAAGWAVSAGIEALQATGMPADVVARVPLARYVLGTTFVPLDLVWYAAGAVLGGLLVALARADLGEIQVRHTRSVRAHRRGLVTAIVAAPLALALAAGGAVAWTLRGEARDLRADLAPARAALAASEGRVADEATRTALAASLDDAAALLAERPVLERRPGAAPRAGEELTTRVEAVVASRLAEARTVAGTARDALAPVTTRGDQVLAATDGLGADEKVRAALATVLGGAADTSAHASGDGLAAATDPAAVERTAAELTTAHDAVGAATVALLTAQDAVTCPFPDQVWFPETGRLADAGLAPIPWAPTYRLRADVLPTLVALDDAFRAHFGHDLPINSAYRSYAEQVAVYNPAHPNPLAAPPGCSNHGLGTAVDIDGISTTGNAEYAWLEANAETYGWTHPDWAEPSGRLPEPWHWQSVKTPTSY
ncbi:DUF2809 domain-containing protein [Xylanimonas sp. McL0601]|uniref:DUF2809 domain-containing protein n=1 Tax=Xylanimonas sp. McL0601 TaxID=3414739 RepID=UPI003CED35B6